MHTLTDLIPIYALALSACSEPNQKKLVERCPAQTSGPTVHDSSLVEDEIWTADGSPHQLPYDTSVYATITIEPCATVEIGAGQTVTLFPGALLEAVGAKGNEIVFGRLEDEAWAAIEANGGNLHLEHTIVDGGGDPFNGPTEMAASIVMRSLSGTSTPQAVFEISHLTVQNSASNGVMMETQAAFTGDSNDLIVYGSERFPLRVDANLAGSIPPGDYSGNGVDEILIAGEAPVAEDMTLHNRGVPYRVGDALGSGELRVGVGEGLATLTIEPGVELRFKAGGLLDIEAFQSDAPASGALVAVGTEKQPIIFTSAADEAEAGDWLGIWFGNIPDPSSKIAHAEVWFAGGESPSGSHSCLLSGEPINNAAIRIFGLPSESFVTDTLIAHSAAHGFDRGWLSNERPDFLQTNSFQDIALCEQTFPGDPDDVCPDPVPCP